MSIKCCDIINHMEKLAPVKYAMDWDNVGFLVGNSNQKVRKVLIALDATSQVIDEAIEQKVDIIITHHPIIFKSIKKITEDSIKCKNIIKLIKNDICVYSAHTNLDVVPGGTSDIMMNLFDVENIEVLKPIQVTKSIISLEIRENGYGFGKIATLKESIKLKDFVEIVKDKLGLKNIKVSGDLDKEIKRIALCTGSGMEFIKEAFIQRADVYITSDIKYHEASDALHQGMALIDATHYASENIVVPKLCEYIKKLDEKLEVIASSINGEPFIIA